MNRPMFRFAPSPNGHLHLGHAYSALLNAKRARQSGGQFLLRLEDIDRLRCRADFATQVLEDLQWLGLRWDGEVRWQSAHLEAYGEQQERLRSQGLLYPCFCSRRDLALTGDPVLTDPDASPLYSGTCRHLPPDVSENRIARGEPHAWRLAMDKAIEEAGPRHRLAQLWGDVVLVRKDIGTSYHIAVVTDDHLQGVTHVLRGCDLEAATPIHRLLQALLGFASPHYEHHALIGDEAGQKLSKSAESRSLRSLRQAGVTAAEIRKRLGFA